MRTRAVRAFIDGRADTQGLTDAQLANLADRLSHELLFPEVHAQADRSAGSKKVVAGACGAQAIKGKSGPKPRGAQKILLMRVREILTEFGVATPEWVSGLGRRTTLSDLCRGLLRAGDIKGLPFSERQARRAGDSQATAASVNIAENSTAVTTVAATAGGKD
ncbi:MAG: hypothetical protein H0W48_03290 [Methylibium sp.]|nr:hypothetical protein [Methylibium sp.]